MLGRTPELKEHMTLESENARVATHSPPASAARGSANMAQMTLMVRLINILPQWTP